MLPCPEVEIFLSDCKNQTSPKTKAINLKKQQMKKNLLTLSILGLTSVMAYSQSTIWKPHDISVDTSWGIRYLSAVDSNTVWAIAYDGSNPIRSTNTFVKTGNGSSFTKGTFLPDTNTYAASTIFALDSMTAYIPLYTQAGDGSSGKIIKTSDGGLTWTKASDSLTMFTGVDNFPDFVYFWDQNNGIAMGDPNGNTGGGSM